MPRLEPLWKKYRDRGLSIVAVEATRDRERAVKFIDKYNLTYHLLEAEHEKQIIKDQFYVKWFPTSHLVDREGRILVTHVGFKTGDEAELEKEIVKYAGL